MDRRIFLTNFLSPGPKECIRDKRNEKGSYEQTLHKSQVHSEELIKTLIYTRRQRLKSAIHLRLKKRTLKYAWEVS